MCQRPDHDQHNRHDNQRRDQQRAWRLLLVLARAVFRFCQLQLLQHAERQVILTAVHRFRHEVSHHAHRDRYRNPQQHQPAHVGSQQSGRSRGAGVSRQRHMNGQHHARHGQAILQRRDAGHFGKTVDQRNNNNKADFKKDRNTQNKRCHGERRDGAFNPQRMGKPLRQRFCAAGGFNNRAEHRPQHDDDGDGPQQTAHSGDDHFHNIICRDAGSHRHHQADNQQSDKRMDLYFNHQQQQYQHAGNGNG